MYEEAIGDTRQYIEMEIRKFEEILDQQNRDEIAEARQTLKEFLDNIEEDIF